MLAFYSASRRGGPPAWAWPAPRGRGVRGATPAGAVALYAAGARSTFGRISGGPAEAGLAPTRVALTCRGTGEARVDAVRVVAGG
jgi:hypothetical protein